MKAFPNVRIVAGFPGVGKTTFATQAADRGILVSDSDSSKFSKDGFPQNYFSHIAGCLLSGQLVMCSTHATVVQNLGKHFSATRWALVYPDRSLKEEYLQRYRNRGSPEAFVTLLDTKWDSFVDDLEGVQNPTVRIILQSGEFLANRIKEIL